MVWSRSTRIVLLWGNGKRADYMPDGKKYFKVDAKQEAALLTYLLGVKNPGAEDFRLLQRAVEIHPDGSWGPGSKSALVRKAQKCARTGCEIKMSSTTHDIFIVFKKRG